MPSTDTITAFYVFDVGVRPRVGQVNNNFSVFRGHVIAVDPSTATAASSGQYHLGSTDYRWRDSYMRKVDLSVTSTANIILQVTAGEYHLGSNATTTAFKISDNGFTGKNITAANGFTSTAAVGDIARSSALNSSFAVGDVAGSTCTLQTVGRPVMVCLQSIVSATDSGFIRSEYLNFATNAGYHILGFKRDGAVIWTTKIGHYPSTFTDEKITYPPGYFKVIDTPAAGTYVYSLFVSANTSDADPVISNVQLVAVEM